MDMIVRERNKHITAHTPREETTAGREIEQNSPLYTALRREVSSQVLQWQEVYVYSEKSIYLLILHLLSIKTRSLVKLDMLVEGNDIRLASLRTLCPEETTPLTPC
jgi:hypothetical protein